MKTLDQLLVPVTDAEAAQIMLDALAAQDPPLPVTSWQSGSVPQVLVAVFADSEGNLYTGRINVAQGGYLGLATGDWLTLLAYQNYGTLRDPAVATRGLVQFYDVGSGGPYTLTAQVTTVSDGTRLYIVDQDATLPVGGKVFAEVTASATGVAGNVSNGAITTLVTALSGVTVENVVPWITVFGDASTATAGYVTLTSTAGGTFAVGACSVQAGGGPIYANTTAVTLLAGVAQEVLFQATAVGPKNVGNDTITTVLVDPLGDITCNNPAPAAVTTWITRAGSDEQSDASLTAECQNLLLARGVDWTSSGIEYLVSQAPISSGSAITRTLVVSNPGGVAGRIGVYIATAAGAASPGDVADVQSYLDDSRSLCATVVVASATVKTITITYTAKVPMAYLATAQAAAAANLAALEANTPIGGAANANYSIQLEDIISAIKSASYDAAGTQTNPASPTQIEVPFPAADVPLGTTDVPDFIINPTWVGV